MNREQSIIQNLQDAGCDTSLINAFIKSYRDQKTAEQMRLLARQRGALLHDIHDSQKKLDCLDYLIHQLRKEQTQYDL